MTKQVSERLPLLAAGMLFALVSSGALAYAQQANIQIPPAQSNVQAVPNMGQQISPLAPQGSRFEGMNPDLADNTDWLAGQAVTTVVSPDKKTLLVLTSGYNRFFNTNDPPPPPAKPWLAADSTEYVFVYDISAPKAIKKQVLQVPVTYSGIVFDPSGLAFYVGGGGGDNVYIFALRPATATAPASWTIAGSLALGHNGVGVGLDVKPNGALAVNSQVGVVPCAAGVAISKDGKTLVVANYYNDSITVFNGGFGHWLKGAELDLRPGKTDRTKIGLPGGEYPYWVVVKGSGTDAVAYVSSIRDREIVVAKLVGEPGLMGLIGGPTVIARIPVKGQPNRMILNAAQSLLFVAADQADTVDIIDTAANKLLESIPVIAKAPTMPDDLARYKGANPNSVTLSPDEKQLYVTNGNLNCIAVIDLSGTSAEHRVVGLIPTGWYPNSVSFSGVGNFVYVVNGKSPTGPNPFFCYGGYAPVGAPTCLASNQYNPQLTKAGFQSFPRPSATQLTTLTEQVARNNRFASTESDEDKAIMAAVRQGIQHVIFIIKENRTYDQVLGDLEVGNGDPDLTEFGQAITPNHHALGRSFALLDNFLDTAEVSYDGWLWTTSAQAPDVIQKQYPVAYSYRGTSLDSEGLNRNVNTALTGAERKKANPFTSDDPDVLPGNTNTDAPDGPNNEVNTGYLWDSALRANLTVRNYGFFIDTTLYNTNDYAIPVERDPFSKKLVVANASSVSLTPYTDPYFRGFDNSLPDYYRFKEWEREFDTNYAKGGLPALSLVRLMHDHTGNYLTAIDGVNTPETQVADNDYAVGLLVQKVANSIYAKNTLIFIIEDDAQDGGDHMDSHRSIAFVVGAYVKQNAIVSTQYNTINFVRTIEEVLGLPPMNLNDALARPMTDIFNATDLLNKTPSPWSFTAVPSPILYRTQLPLPVKPLGLVVPKSTHDARYWAKVTNGMDFEDEDRVDPKDFNRILWKGLMGKKRYPAATTGLDLRQNREELLARYQRSLKQKAAPVSKTAARIK